MTTGISPKVKLPAAALIGIGIALLVLWLILGEDTLLKLGLAVLASAGIQIPIGYQADPGAVVHHTSPASDDMMAPAAVHALEADASEVRSSADLEPPNQDV